MLFFVLCHTKNTVQLRAFILAILSVCKDIFTDMLLVTSLLLQVFAKELYYNEI